MEIVLKREIVFRYKFWDIEEFKMVFLFSRVNLRGLEN